MKKIRRPEGCYRAYAAQKGLCWPLPFPRLPPAIIPR